MTVQEIHRYVPDSYKHTEPSTLADLCRAREGAPVWTDAVSGDPVAELQFLEADFDDAVRGGPSFDHEHSSQLLRRLRNAYARTSPGCVSEILMQNGIEVLRGLSLRRQIEIRSLPPRDPLELEPHLRKLEAWLNRKPGWIQEDAKSLFDWLVTLAENRPAAFAAPILLSALRVSPVAEVRDTVRLDLLENLSRTAFSTGEKALELNATLAAFELAEKVCDPRSSRFLRITLARLGCLKEHRDYESMRTEGQRVLAAVQRVGGEGICLADFAITHRLARLDLEEGKVTKAKETLHLGLRLARERLWGSDRSVILDYLESIAFALSRESNHDAAAAYLDELVDEARAQKGEMSGRFAAALCLRAECHAARGCPDEMREDGEKALTILRNLPEFSLLRAHALRLNVIACCSLERYDDAIAYGREGVLLTDTLQNTARNERVFFLTSLGYLLVSSHVTTEEPEEALGMLQLADLLAEEEMEAAAKRKVRLESIKKIAASIEHWEIVEWSSNKLRTLPDQGNLSSPEDLDHA